MSAHTSKSDKAIISKGCPDSGCTYAPETRVASILYYAAINREYRRECQRYGFGPEFEREDFHSDIGVA